ncbi:MAG: 16S rRNA (cytosine(967)-C(5))-methyltransferase RsmB [Nitrospiraceae bacterium]|nr:16S rRNA (cytosine(967)-C(5))-methyltransferase RsmB [Nitrospiraceae bacterium]MSR24256.1 16S rRNA (cytosine(967)-C(5))-methyltransferase RsmB [Nitrospiraceae bacterium]
MKPLPGARAVALDALLSVERTQTFADDALDHYINRSALDSRDRALALELVYGILRHQSTLDWRLDQVATKSVAKLPARVRMALRLGAYQLLHLDKIPPSAAVNESVALMKTGGASAHWPGFVNAVLRALTRTPAPPWPDRETDPVRALSVRHACPAWLTERWLARFGIQDAETLCRATTVVPPLTIRVNTLRTTRDALAARFTKLGYAVRPTKISPVGLVLDKCGSVAELPLFRDGAFYVEDEAAQLVAPIVDPQPGELVLDACAAPGGKTTHLAALMQNNGELFAVDSSAARLRLLEDNCRRLGIGIIRTIPADIASPLPPSLRERPFDRILLDAPCSGLGVLRRHPEGKWRKKAEAFSQHQALQRQLLEQAGNRLRPGGVLVYSTCSSEPEENEQVIDQFCKEHKEFRRESVAPWLPEPGSSLVTSQGDLSTVRNNDSMDVFFAARLRKAS